MLSPFFLLSLQPLLHLGLDRLHLLHQPVLLRLFLLVTSLAARVRVRAVALALVPARRLAPLLEHLVSLLLHCQPPPQQLLELRPTQHLQVLAQALDLRRRRLVRRHHLPDDLQLLVPAPVPGRRSNLERDLRVLPQHLHRTILLHKRLDRNLLERRADPLLVPLAEPPLLVLRTQQRVRTLYLLLLRKVREDILGVEQPRVNLARRLVPLAHHEDLRRRVPARRRLGRLHLLVQLLQRVYQRRVVLRAEHFGHERAPGRENVRRHARGLEHQLGLRVRFARPGASDVWRTVTQHNIDQFAFRLLLDEMPALLRRDIADEGLDAADGFDGKQVDRHDGRAHRTRLRSHLGPSSRRSAQIDDGTCRREEVILPVELDELERRSRPIPGVWADDGVSASASAWMCV